MNAVEALAGAVQVGVLMSDLLSINGAASGLGNVKTSAAALFLSEDRIPISD